MFLLEMDKRHNRVHMTLSENFDKSQAKALLIELQERQDEISTEFHVLCDLSSLEEFDHEAKLYFRKIMDICNKLNVQKIIRILPDPRDNFGLNLMSYFHYNDEVKVINCKSLKEAQKHL